MPLSVEKIEFADLQLLIDPIPALTYSCLPDGYLITASRVDSDIWALHLADVEEWTSCERSGDDLSLQEPWPFQNKNRSCRTR